jgi:hypothetical protein
MVLSRDVKTANSSSRWPWWNLRGSSFTTLGSRWEASTVLCWGEKGRSRLPHSSCQLRKKHGFSPALCGIDAVYMLTARDCGLGQLTERLWSSTVGRGGYLGHTISLGIK